MRARWDRFWFEPGSPLALIAARSLLALNALWIILSRPGLPDLVRWPGIFWSDADIFTRIRFLVPPFPFGIEVALYTILVVGLLLVLTGRFVRGAALTSAVILYHFADFEKIFSSPGSPFFRGLTVPVSGLFIVAFAQIPRRDDPPSPEYRWPVKLIQLLFGLTYLMAGISKLRIIGLRWFRPENFEGILLAKMLPDAMPPWAQLFADHRALIWLGAIGGIAIDFLPIFAVFSRRAARVIVPATFIAHMVILRVLDVMFLNLPLLLLFVNWDWVAARWRTRSDGQSGIAETARG